jgi:hypothetical protein
LAVEINITNQSMEAMRIEQLNRKLVKYFDEVKHGDHLNP